MQNKVEPIAMTMPTPTVEVCDKMLGKGQS